MKKTLSFFALLLVACTLRAATWTDPATGYTWNYRIEGNGVTIEGEGWYTPAISPLPSGTLNVPAVIAGKPVTAIGGFAFKNCSALTEIRIPDGVTLIGGYAFSECSALKEIRIPDGVTAIGYYAFEYCPALAEISIPDGITSIGDGAFSRCFALAEIRIPDGVTSIGSFAFYFCTSLTEIRIPDGVTSIGNDAFHKCSALTKIRIPDAVTSIGAEAFRYCSSLTDLHIPAAVKTIGKDAFLYCKGPFYFSGRPPAAIDLTRLPKHRVYYPKAYADEWTKALGQGYLGLQDLFPRATVTTSARMVTPTRMEVTYRVVSASPTVKVRAVAFQDGVRSFAKLVRIQSGANVPDGGAVSANADHTFTWDVSKDWSAELSKVSVEILVQENDLLPLDLVTIPSTASHAEMTISRNVIPLRLAASALLWSVAEGDPALLLENGKVTWNGEELADGDRLGNPRNYSPLFRYLYGKVGHRLLEGEELAYAREATRLELPNDPQEGLLLSIRSPKE